eukprot:1628983-Alexandrium_andersonii.AAC.1
MERMVAGLSPSCSFPRSTAGRATLGKSRLGVITGRSTVVRPLSRLSSPPMPRLSSSTDSSNCNLIINSTFSMFWRALRPRWRPSDKRSSRSNLRPR